MKVRLRSAWKELEYVAVTSPRGAPSTRTLRAVRGAARAMHRARSRPEGMSTMQTGPVLLRTAVRRKGQPIRHRSGLKIGPVFSSEIASLSNPVRSLGGHVTGVQEKPASCRVAATYAQAPDAAE